ncbi:MAG: biotin--[acetyl-CoA-carboxylase] ligase [Deltaproteobacteria bacterium]|nr:biotin--[acetyl-CoA-carboxylase] ligase [Deltaproteobacteria bacterium]
MNVSQPECVNHRTYDLADLPERGLRDLTAGRLIGREILYFNVIDSTNLYAAKVAHQGIPEGTVIIADCQTKGRGRLNRVWQSPPGRNLYTSIILRPLVEPSVAPQLTLLAGVAVADVLSLYCDRQATLKWPNDVQVRGKKICGILTEMRTSGASVEYVVIGIGINLNMRRDEFHEDFRETSTSVREENGADVSRVAFAADLYGSVERWYGEYHQNGFEPIRDTWLTYAGIVGRQIRVNRPDDIQKGTVLGIDEYGALLIHDDEKNVKRVLSGDISLLGDETCY